MSDIRLTIGDESRNFNLAVENGKKLFAIVEEPIVPLRAAQDVPGYGDLPAEKVLAFVQNTWQGGMGQKNKFNTPDMYSDGQNIDTRNANLIFLGPSLNTIGTLGVAPIAFEFFKEREYAASSKKLYKLNEAGDTWTEVLDTDYITVLENCEDAWNEISPGNVTNSLDTTDFKNGSGSAKCAIGTAVAANTKVASEAISSTDLSDATKIRLWIKCSVNAASGDLKLMLDDTAQCATPLETIVIPALVADTWTEVTLTLANPASDTAIISIGLLYYTDLGECNIWIDDVRYDGSDTIKCLSQYDGYIYVGFTTAKYRYSSTGEAGTFTQCTLDNAVAHFFCVSPPFEGTKDIMVLAEISNKVRTTTDPKNGGVAWVDPPYYIGDETSDITGLWVLNGTLFIGKEDGAYSLPADGRPLALFPEFKQKRDSTNFKYWTYWSSVYYGSLSGDIVEIIGGSSSIFSVDYVGPLKNAPELSTIGSVIGLTADDKNIYALLLVDTSYIIYAGRQRRDKNYGLRWEWIPYVDLSTNACTAIRVMQRDGENPKLWLGYGTAVKNVVLSRSPNYPLGDSNYKFTTQGYLITSYFDANYDVWSKMFYKLWIVADDIEQNHQYINIYYQKDTDTTWTALCVISENGTKCYDIPILYCTKVRLKIELNSDDTSKTPVVNMFILRGILQPEITRSIDFMLILEQSDSRKVSKDLAFLLNGRSTTEPITMEDLRFGTTRYITFLSNSPMEVEFISEIGQPSYQARILAQELNWKPQ